MQWLLIGLLALAGVFRALSDAIAHGGQKVVAWGPFFDNANSWKLKYNAAGTGPAFFGSTTFLVFLSDGWHLFNFLQGLCLDVAFLLAAFPVYRWYAVGAVVARRCVFEPIYAFLKKP